MEKSEIILNFLSDYNKSALDSADDPDNIEIRRVLDSLGMLDFITFLEKTFSIRIEDKDVLSGNFGTINSVVKYVEGKCK